MSTAAMRGLDRQTLQTLATKLDLGYMKVKEAKDLLWHTYGFEVKGRTKTAIIREVAAEIRKGEAL